jgi:glycosyltransferase involved in cell wall biosynthesis
MEYRPYYMAREWVRMGHQVTIIAASNSHVRTVQPTFGKYYVRQFIEGIDYVWIKTPAYQGNGIKRIINMFAFVSRLYLNAASFAKQYQPDIVIASSTYPLDILPAKLIARKSKAKLIFEVHDLWPLSPMELGGYSKWNPFIFSMQLAENYACRKCDSLVSILPKTKEHLVEHGLEPGKFNYIPNGINIDEYSSTEPLPTEHEEVLTNFRIENKTIICYAGSHGIANALDWLVDAAKNLSNEPFGFLFVGSGPEKARLIEKAEKMELKNVYFLSAVSKKSLLTLLGNCDILYIGLQNKPLFRFGISPNKLFDYMMAGKPIVQSINAGNDLVTENNCGISVEPENAREIAEAVRTITKMSIDEREKLGMNGKQYVISQHNYSFLAEQFIHVMKNS